MNTFSLHARFNASTADARVIAALVETFLQQHGFTYPLEFAPQVTRENFLVGDTVYEVWVHQGEDGMGCLKITLDESAADYDVMRLQMTGTPLERRTAHKRTVVVTQAWLDQFNDDPDPISEP